MPMLIKFCLISPKKQILPPFTGPHVRGFFLNIVKNNIESTKFHETQELRPYAVKPLYQPKGRKSIVKNKWLVERDSRLVFEIGIIDPCFEDVVLRSIVGRVKDIIRIGGAEFVFDHMDVRMEKSFEKLLPGTTASFVGVEFKTPTLFSKTSSTYLFPDPVRVFKSLVNIWNSYAEDDVRIEEDHFLDWINNRVYVRYYGLKTREVRIKDVPIVGFKGRVSYVVMDPDIEEAEILLALLKLGTISNVGLKRTFGLGVIEPKDLTHNKTIDLDYRD